MKATTFKTQAGHSKKMEGKTQFQTKSKAQTGEIAILNKINTVRANSQK